jgi:hypothetical protein
VQKDKIHLDIHITPCFPIESFVVKLNIIQYTQGILANDNTPMTLSLMLAARKLKLGNAEYQ